MNTFDIAYLCLVNNLKFPVQKKDRWHYSVGRHQWMMSEFNQGMKFYEWDFMKNRHNSESGYGVEIPDFWRKVNNGWQIVY